MINIAICDDDEIELNRTSSECINYANKYPQYNMKISKFVKADDLDFHIKHRNGFHIIILDIYMPNMTGIDLAYSIRERKDQCEIIFLTNSPNHAIEAFTLNAAHYLLKPYTRDQFKIALSKAFSQIEKQKKAQITLKSSNSIQKIFLKDFIYSETEEHLQNIHLEDGRYLKTRITSIELFEKLSQDKRFYKCGSTYIINLEKVKEITSQTIFLDNGEQIPMQRRHYKTIIDQYTSYSLEGN